MKPAIKAPQYAVRLATKPRNKIRPMNTTPAFEDIRHTTPLETPRHVRSRAALRLSLVAVAICVGVAQMAHSHVWSGLMDRTVLLAGLWGGLGLYGDGLEPAWRRLGQTGRQTGHTVIVLIGLILVAAGLFFADNLLWRSAALGLALIVLGALAYGLAQTLIAPQRAARYRQMQRHIRAQPRAERNSARNRLEKGYQTLLAEGFE